MLRGLIYYWRLHLAVLLAAAVASTVITGALLVGDSVRGSLRDLTLERLGKVDYALVTERPFRGGLAVRLAEELADSSLQVASMLAMRGSAVHSLSQARSSSVQVYAVDQGFESLLGSRLALQQETNQIFPSVVINRQLQQELGASVGDQIMVGIPQSSDIHRELLFGNSDPTQQIRSLRVTVMAVLEDRGIGRFSIEANQAIPSNAFLQLDVAQQALDLEGQVNALLVGGEKVSGSAFDRLQLALKAAIELEEFGLSLVAEEEYLRVESNEIVMPGWVVAALQGAADNQGWPVQKVLTYLANRISSGDRAIPYSTLSALDPGPSELPQLVGSGGEIWNDRLAEDEILLNSWAAADLRIEAGDPIEIDYYFVGPRDQLLTRTASFRLAGVVGLDQLGGDRHLTPTFPGIQDAEDMASWEPPFPVDLNRIRPRDEDYWDLYLATPKGFISFKTGSRLWGSRFGDVTSLRLTAEDPARVRQVLLQHLDAARRGFLFRDVKRQGLEMSAGPTDFSGLFIGFSFFLILSALLIVGLLFRLGVERRVKEVGLLKALGYRSGQVLRRFVGEGAILIVLGAGLGLLGGVGYCWLLMVALRTWWLAAVGTGYLFFHGTATSLLLGYLITVATALLFVWGAVGRLVKLPETVLLVGRVRVLTGDRVSRWQRVLAWGFLGLGLLFVLSLTLGPLTGWQPASGLLSVGFFVGGACLLAGGLILFSIWCRSGGTPRPTALGTTHLALRSITRIPGRSVLSAMLVASACFVIVAVGANRMTSQGSEAGVDSGTGGFNLVAESEIPLLQNLSTAEGRFDLSFSETDSELLEEVVFFPLRLSRGDDASCLNLYRPRKPRLLGAPVDLIQRGGFHLAQVTEEKQNAWELLDQELGPGVVPAFGDQESVRWILQLQLGQELVMQNESGADLRLRLVGLIQDSIFQSELIISEQNFLRHFPGDSGYQFFLIDAPAASRDGVRDSLERTLSAYGFDATPSEDRLARFHAVRNTYISTFQTLGGLGLVLGTIGLGVILIRNVNERLKELAVLRAIGFSRRRLAWTVLLENVFLLSVGIGLGTLAAAAAVAPHWLGGGGALQWNSLGLTLASVFAVGMLASLAALKAALSVPMLPSLKSE